MYRKNKVQKTSINRYDTVEGETIETKIERVVNNSEPITDNAEIIYTERKDGVLPAYDIRTDRFEIAVDAMDKVNKSKEAKSKAKGEAKIIKMDDKKGSAETESTGGTKDGDN